MPTWRHLFQQRLRWQSGMLAALRRYGITRATWTHWARQAFFYGRYCSQLACWTIIAWSLVTHPELTIPPWVLGMTLAIHLERVVTAWKAGPKGIILAALLFPEWWYGMFDGLYLLQALRREFTPARRFLGTCGEGLSDYDPRNSRILFPAERTVHVPAAGDSGLCAFGDRPPDSGQAQAGARPPPPGFRQWSGPAVVPAIVRGPAREPDLQDRCGTEPGAFSRSAARSTPYRAGHRYRGGAWGSCSHQGWNLPRAPGEHVGGYLHGLG